MRDHVDLGLQACYSQIMTNIEPKGHLSALETLQTLADEIRRLVDKYPDSEIELIALGRSIEELDTAESKNSDD